MAVAAVVGVVAAGAAVYQGLTQSAEAKRAFQRQKIGQLEAVGAAVSAKRNAERAQRVALAKKPNPSALNTPSSVTSSIDPTVLTPAAQRLGGDTALGTGGRKL